MQQAEHLLQGQRDYSKIVGEAGPLVYPALHSYFYMLLASEKVSNYGEFRFFPTLFSIFAHLITTYFSIKIYQLAFQSHPKKTNLLSLLLFTLAPTTIAIDHLFNDVYSTMLQTLSIYSFMLGKNFFGAVLISLAFGFKLGPLLIMPAVYLVTAKSQGIFIGTAYMGLIVAIQVIMSVPFTTAYPSEYFKAAYNIGRKFGNSAILNYRLVPLSILWSDYLTVLLTI